MLPRYRLYGIVAESALPLPYNVPRTTASPHLRIERIQGGFPSSLWERMEVVSKEEAEGTVAGTIHRDRTAFRHVMQFEDVASFLLAPDAITYHLSEAAPAHAAEVWLMGAVFSLWNELQRRPALHAAAVEVSGSAVGFLATNKGGKSSLAAALLQLGCPLLTDDILVTEAVGEEVVGRPSYPQMRMWPDQAAHFLGTSAAEALPRVVPHLSKRRVSVGTDGFGDFCETAYPISTLFLPERRTDVREVRTDLLSPSEALIELVRHSFLANTVNRLGLAPDRLPVLFALAHQVRMYRLVYPDGEQHLSRVADAVLQIVTEGFGARPSRTGAELQATGQ